MNSKITALLFAFALTSVAAIADAPTSLSVTAASDATFTVQYKTSSAGKVKVSIYDETNVLVFTETLNNVASFVRPYNFSELSEGQYTIVLEDKNGKQAEKVNYAKNKITSFIKVTEIANSENKYFLHVSNNGTEEVLVRIFDVKGNLLHEQEAKVTGSFGLVFNLSSVVPVHSSEITFQVSTSSGKVETITF